MPILDRLTGDAPDPQGGGGFARRDDPQLVRGGGRTYTLNALRERVEAQFDAETAGRDDILFGPDAESTRRALLRECLNYVLATESVFLDRETKAGLFEQAHANLFGFGPVEQYLDDETLTEVAIDGPDRIYARWGFGELERLPVYFDDAAHLHTTVARVLAAARTGRSGAAHLSDWGHCMEVGVMLRGRPARMGLIAPPISPHLQVQLRLHPRAPLTLDDLIAGGVMTGAAAHAITDHIAAGRGLLLIGDAGSGKTTLLGALGPAFTQGGARVVAVQRADELRLPEGVEVRAAIPPADSDPGVDFGAQIEAALAGAVRPDWLLLDEMRDDAARAAWAALCAPAGAATGEGEGAPRCAWVFRAEPDPERVRNALSMLLRRARPAVEQGEINRLLAARLPLVVALALVKGAARVVSVAAFTLGAGGQLTLRPRFALDGSGALVEVAA